MTLSDLGQTHKRGTSGYTSKLLKTGQTTQYDSELDDGYYEVGVAKSYTVNTTGAQSGTTNVDLAHYISGAGAISFNNTTKKITDSGSGLAIFKTGDIILTSSANNPGPFTVTTGNVAGEIVCSGATFTDETPAGAVTISKREAISNNTVLDNNTGLTWLRYPSLKMGAKSNGALIYRESLYDIWAYLAAANAASVGGYNDWRIPNVTELHTLAEYEYPQAYPNSTAFPSFGVSLAGIWSSTVDVYNGSARHYYYNYYAGGFGNAYNDTATWFVLLVRGGTA